MQVPLLIAKHRVTDEKREKRDEAGADCGEMNMEVRIQRNSNASFNSLLWCDSDYINF